MRHNRQHSRELHGSFGFLAVFCLGQAAETNHGALPLPELLATLFTTISAGSQHQQ
jgi:hypothetical protein